MQQEQLKELINNLKELFNDRQETTQEFIKKTERVINLFVSLYLQPDLKDRATLLPIVFNEKKLKLEGDTRYRLGVERHGQVHLNIGILYNIYDKIDPPEEIELEGQENEKTERSQEEMQELYFIIRNQTILELIDAVAHETRHVFQHFYYKFRNSGERDKAEVYKDILGAGAEHIVSDFLDVNQNAVYAVLLILGHKNEILKARIEELMDEEGGYFLYARQPHEKDARRYSLSKVLQFKKDILKLWKKGEVTKSSALNLNSIKNTAVMKLADIQAVRNNLTLLFSHFYIEEVEIFEEEKDFNSWFIQAEKEIEVDDVICYFETMEKSKKGFLGVIEEALQEARDLFNSSYLRQIFDDREKCEELKKKLKERGIEHGVKILIAKELGEFDSEECYDY